MPEITYGRWSPTEVMERVLDGTWVIADDADATDAALMMVPTSIAYTGTSATVTASGSVEFTACSSLSLNGVFSADYDNYMIAVAHTLSAGTVNYKGRFRASGTDNSTASSYTSQELNAYGTTVSGGARFVSDSGYFIASTSAQNSGSSLFLFGPYLAQPTAWRQVNVTSYSSAAIFDLVGTHNQSVSYDGFSFVPTSTYSLTGTLSVYGIRGA